jgi:hypothetical protein
VALVESNGKEDVRCLREAVANKWFVVRVLEIRILKIDVGPSKLFDATGVLVKGAIEALMERAVASGDIRPDLDPLDLLRAWSASPT